MKDKCDEPGLDLNEHLKLWASHIAVNTMIAVCLVRCHVQNISTCYFIELLRQSRRYIHFTDEGLTGKTY